MALPSKQGWAIARVDTSGDGPREILLETIRATETEAWSAAMRFIARRSFVPHLPVAVQLRDAGLASGLQCVQVTVSDAIP